MSIKINNNTIAGNLPKAYRYVGEIFQSSLPIVDPKVVQLNGQKLFYSSGYKSFIDYIKTFQDYYPQLFCTEEEWQAIANKYNECGKFVLEETAVRLPKIIGILQGVANISQLGNLIEAGLPNITLKLPTTDVYHTVQGGTARIYTGTSTGEYSLNDQNDFIQGDKTFGNSDTVQPQTIQYPYYIVVATGVVQEINVKEEFEINIPFTLLEYKYSEIELNNASWLLSSGQWNTKEMYPDAYNKIIKEYNKPNNEFSIKLNTSTETITDYDFVLNTTNETFRLPIKTKFSLIKEKNPVVGNDKTLGFTNGSVTCALSAQNNQYTLSMLSNSYDIDTSTDLITGSTISGNFGVTSDPTKSGLEIYTDTSELKLYFYVGETNKNPALINAGEINESLTKKLDKSSVKAYITETYQSGTSGYRIWSDGWCEQWGEANSTNITLLKAYKDTNYKFLVYWNNANTQYSYQSAAYYLTNKTTSDCTLAASFVGDWYAKGYI